MEKRKLGNSGLQIAPLALGSNVFGWTADEANSFQILNRFVDAGFNLIDTADVYSRWASGHEGGESETTIGKWLKQTGNREKVLIATKVGMEMGPEKKGLSKAYILRAVEDSLQRLRTDHIDLYQSHRDDPDTPIAETLEAYTDLIKQGKVKAIGASNFTAERLTEALKIGNKSGLALYQSLQPEYNLCERAAYESKLEPACLNAGVGVICYFGLARGFLTGKYRSEKDLSKSRRGEGVRKYLDERGFRILAALDQIAKELNSTPTSVALAWLMARPSITAPIASATSVEQLNDLLAAATLRLDQSHIEALNLASEWEETT
jgi:aryl-alcohol dehydrogenase-like predicted oxidoreductase